MGGKKIIAYIAYIVYKSLLYIEHMFDVIHTVLPYTVVRLAFSARVSACIYIEIPPETTPGGIHIHYNYLFLLLVRKLGILISFSSTVGSTLPGLVSPGISRLAVSVPDVTGR